MFAIAFSDTSSPLGAGLRNRFESTTFRFVADHPAELSWRDESQVREYLAEVKPHLVLNTIGWGEGTATFMILGNICTRSCGFCNVATGRPLPVDWDEPDRVARSIQRMKIKHAVLTSVDRDDLADGGSIIWAETVSAVRRLSPGTTMETLIPDFRGITDQIDRIVEAAPEVVSHNMETVRRLTRQVRIQAQYDRSLEVLRYLKANGVNRTKTGIMLGLGETEDELYQTLDEVRSVGVDVVTLGQYLQPSARHLPVQRFVEPEEFERLGAYARTLGFRHVESSPLVRSSYHAERHVH